MGTRLHASYLIETAGDPASVAEVMAGEQSSGTFIKVPGETPELRRRFGAQVERAVVIGEVDAPSLSGAYPAKPGERYKRVEVDLSWPLENTGTNLPTVLATVAGNLFELKQLSGCRLMNVEFPDAFATAYQGPQFGVAGTRALCGVATGPIVGTIVKPSVGLTPKQTGELAGSLAEAGIDFIKDDELMANPPHSPLAERVSEVMTAINRVAQRTGRKAMYAFNITDETDEMIRHHDLIKAAGGTCVMVSVNSVGLSGMTHLRRRCALPIHGHRNGWGLYTRHPLLGMAYTAYHKFWRLAGADHLHVNGLANKFCETDDSVVTSITELRKPMLGHLCPMPVISSGQWGGQAPETYQRTGTSDVMYVAGGGVMAHPSGPAAGLRALRQCWEAAVAGIPLEEYATTRPELRDQISTFGSRAKGKSS